MAERTARLGYMHYRDTDGCIRDAVAGETIKVHPDDVQRFDSLNFLMGEEPGKEDEKAEQDSPCRGEAEGAWPSPEGRFGVTTYAELDDLIARFPRDLTDAEEEAAPTLLGDASFWLGVWVPGLDDAVAANEQLAQAAKLLVVSMVKRSLLSQVPDNPGVQSVTESAGPYSQAVTYRNPEGNLYLYGNELTSITDLLWPNKAQAVSMRSPGL
jgi:hypothetical protein